MVKRYRLLFTLSLLISVSPQAADWQPLGSSDIGQHFMDKDSVAWNADKSVFSITTKVVQKDNAEWLTTLGIDCKAATFTYLSGSESRNDEIVTRFDAPRPPEKIEPQSMPYQLSEDYCAGTKPQPELDWQLLGSSRIADVFFDRSTIRKSQDTGFIADTKVIPFDKSETTISTMAFDCGLRTFTVMKMGKLKNDQVEHIFDKPQPPSSIDKTATLVNLANKFCVPTKQCTEVFARLKSIESAIQASYEHDQLSCKDVKNSVGKIQALNKDVKKYHCPISKLDDYMQQLNQTNCY